MHVGIDLGTTNSAVAVFRDGAPTLIPNAAGGVLTPSVVGLDDDGAVLIGDAAKRRLLTHPDKTFARFKRHMGAEKRFTLGGAKRRAEDLAALVLRSLAEDAAAHLGAPVRDVVISVPAYFNNRQRQATATAAALAELNVVRLVNEPTAAALAYGLQDRDGESTFLVFDLGGGTFDVTLLELFDGVMEARASSGDAFLGGEDFTDALAARVARDIGRKTDDPLARELAERIKQALSSTDTARIEAPAPDVGAITISRADFEAATQSLVDRLMRPIRRCLGDAKTALDELDRVVLVGGATRMPLIHSLVARTFKKLPERTIDPDHVVALGAAVQAALAARDAALGDVVMTDVSPFTLGTAMMTEIGERRIADRYAPIIERNTPVPVSRVRSFSTAQNGQSQVKIEIYQGESAIASENLLLDALTLPVRPAPAGHESVDVRFSYDTSGLLAVDVTVVSTGETRSLVIANGVEAMDEAERAERLAALDALKRHPREDAANQATMERLKEAYAMALGDDRQWLQGLLAHFEATLEDQALEDIDAARAEIEAALEAWDDKFVR